MAAGLRVRGGGDRRWPGPGIGAAICKVLAKEGADIIFYPLKEGDEPEGLLEELRGVGVQRVAIFYTKVHNRLLRPLLAAHDPPAPLPPLRQALRVINHHVDDYVAEAHMAA